MPDGAVVALQCDRDAAIDLVSPEEAQRIASGAGDGHQLVQAFARARIASRALDEPVAQAIALVGRIAARESWQDHYGKRWEDEAAEIAAALAASERRRLAV